MTEKRKVLVLGCCGFMGSHLCRALIENKIPVVGYDLAAPTSCPAGLDFVQGDFSKERDFQRVLQGVDTVFHLISTTIPAEGTENMAREINENIIPTMRLLEGMAIAGTRRIVFISSGGTVYGNTGAHINRPTDPTHPISSYGVQKKMIETILELYYATHGLDYRIARVSNLYGLGQDKDRKQGIIPIFIDRITKNLPITVFGNTYRDYIYVDDLMRALVELVGYDGNERVFNIGSGTSYTIMEVVDKIVSQMGCGKIEVEEQDARSFDVLENHIDISLTEAELGWHPNVSLDEGIRSILDGLA
jgi:UDP-glucose 4-epimerase